MSERDRLRQQLLSEQRAQVVKEKGLEADMPPVPVVPVQQVVAVLEELLLHHAQFVINLEEAIEKLRAHLPKPPEPKKKAKKR